MKNTIIGILIKPLVLDTEMDGKPTILIMPKGMVIEILQKETDYNFTTDKDIIDAIELFEKL